MQDKAVDEAEELTLSTLERIKESRGSEHCDYIFGMWKLGQLHELQNNVAKALSAYRTALENTETRLTQDFPLSKQITMRIMVMEGSNYEIDADRQCSVDDRL